MFTEVGARFTVCLDCANNIIHRISSSYFSFPVTFFLETSNFLLADVNCRLSPSFLASLSLPREPTSLSPSLTTREIKLIREMIHLLSCSREDSPPRPGSSHLWIRERGQRERETNLFRAAVTPRIINLALPRT